MRLVCICSTPRPKILPNILHQIGHTPLVRVNRIGASAGLECELRTFILAICL